MPFGRDAAGDQEEIRPLFACLRPKVNVDKIFEVEDQREALSVSTQFNITDRQYTLLVSTLVQHSRSSWGNTGAQKAGRNFPCNHDVVMRQHTLSVKT